MPATSQIVFVVLISLASLGLGFHLGSGRATLPTERQTEEHHHDEEGSDSDLATVHADLMEQCKLVLVVRTDLNMTPGKIAAQCGHATLACYKALARRNPKLIAHWERIGQAKIALKGTSGEQLLELEAIAKSLNLCVRLIEDQGLTGEGARTVLGIGPAPVALINQVTGKLRLL